MMTDELTPVRCGCGGEAKVAFCQQSYCGQNCFGDIGVGMSYESPIEIAGKMSNQIDGDIMNVILSYGIKVDKNELIKALSYDRGQYEKGYTDGQKAGERTAKVEEVEKPNVFKCSECGQYFHQTAWGSPVEYCSRCGCRLIWGDDNE